MQDETAADPAKPKKKRKIFRWIFLFILLYPFLSIGLLYLIGPPKLIISKETTGLDNPPLTADGMVDYLKYFNDANSKGVTPENNFMNALVEIVGPDVLLASNIKSQYMEAIGFDESAAKGKSFVRVEDIAPNNEQEQKFNDMISECGKKYWNADEHPELASYISKNNQCLLDLRKALEERPCFYMPLISHSKSFTVVNASLPSLSSFRQMARILLCRAMLEASDGKFEAAWQDIMTVRMFGAKIFPHNEDEQNSLITYLVAAGLVNESNETAMTLLADNRLTAKQLKNFRTEFEQCPIRKIKAKQFLLGERAVIIDSAMEIFRGYSMDDLFYDMPSVQGFIYWLCRKNADPNYVLRKFNHAYDLLEACIGDLPDIRKNDESQKNVELFEEQMLNANLTPKLIPVLWMPPNILRQAMSDIAANRILRVLYPSLSGAKNLFAAMKVRSDLVDIGLALREYQLTKGGYPEKLVELVPGYFKELPKDPFSGKDYIYKRTKDGFKLYSIGKNFKDDGGVVTTVGYPRDGDIVLEVPIPEKTVKK